jgi:DNA-binding NarL/FixJ family response regulator
MNLVLCDDHRTFVDALALVLESRGWRVAGRTVSVADAVDVLGTEDIDICVLDINFPDGSGLDGIGRLLAASPRTKVVMLSALADRDTVAAALAAGASGFAMKTSGLDTILDTISRVEAGQLAIEGAEAPAGDRTRRPGHRQPHEFLTARELEVLGCMVAGHNTRALAGQLGVSYATARSHVQNVLLKLGVHSQLQAVAYATANGVVGGRLRVA